MRRGRPTVLTQQVIKRVADCFLVAFTDEQTAEYCGIGQKTIQRIRRGELWPAVKKAELEREMKYRMRIWNGRGYWQGSAWFLERKYPQQFAKPEIQLQINATTNTINAITISAEQAAHNLERLKTVDSRIDQFLKAREQNGDQERHQNGS
jgi:hypothetical protein